LNTELASDSSAPSLPTLVSERLVIRPFVLSDADFILELLNQKSFIDNIADRGVRSIADAEQYLRTGPQRSYLAYQHGLMCVQLKARGSEASERIGMCGVLRRDILDAPDLGYALLDRFSGRGLASEAAATVLQDAQQRLAIHRMLAITSAHNHASIRVLENLGFAFLRMQELYENEPALKVFQLGASL
jgi:[ribosomal protein S5]-alanine N-acetyltransferase